LTIVAVPKLFKSFFCFRSITSNCKMEIENEKPYIVCDPQILKLPYKVNFFAMFCWCRSCHKIDVLEHHLKLHTLRTRIHMPNALLYASFLKHWMD